MANYAELFASALGNSAKNVERKILANGSMEPIQKVLYHKGLKKEMADGVGSDVSSGAMDSAATRYMNNDRGLWAAGGDKGRAGFNDMVGGYRRFKGQGAFRDDALADMDGQLAGLRAGDAHLQGGANHGAYQQMMKERHAMASDMGGIRRYGSAAGQMAGGALKYMNSGSFAQRATKWGTATAAYVGGAGLVKSAGSGGSAFYDGDGRRNVAGIPFI